MRENSEVVIIYPGILCFFLTKDIFFLTKDTSPTKPWYNLEPGDGISVASGPEIPQKKTGLWPFKTYAKIGLDLLKTSSSGWWFFATPLKYDGVKVSWEYSSQYMEK